MTHAINFRALVLGAWFRSPGVPAGWVREREGKRGGIPTLILTIILLGELLSHHWGATPDSRPAQAPPLRDTKSRLRAQTEGQVLETICALQWAESRKEVLGVNMSARHWANLPSVPDVLQISPPLISKSFNLSMLLFLLCITWVDTVLIHKRVVKVKRH